MSSAKTILRGMTWDHSRGYLPMVASAQRYQEMHPEIEIRWEKRSLKAFEEFPVEKLAEEYDLMIIDHPFSGYAAKHRPLLALDEHMPEGFMADQLANQVGKSHESYTYEGHQWALAIDAATPVAFWREDLLAKLGRKVPQTWAELLDLARAGHVVCPAVPINCLMNFYSLCVALGEEPFQSETFISEEIGWQAIADLQELIEACDPVSWQQNPIHSMNLMSSKANQQIAYCPLAYGYSNYARKGYADHLLKFGQPPTYLNQPFYSTLGGTGLALSALRPNVKIAVDYAQFAASANTQRHLSTLAGGQPGHRSAWLNATNNAITHNYFKDTLPTLDRSFLRPRYCGYTRFQEEGGPILHRALRRETKPHDALRELNELYRHTLATA
ncbi:MAG: ABC transporter substrate-binding protein [Verrucomicrobiota bacterium JB022]|nr:ABC transporter substrate-binding protein [Verrucomicrobiota bacterium JB022]